MTGTGLIQYSWKSNERTKEYNTQLGVTIQLEEYKIRYSCRVIKERKNLYRSHMSRNRLAVGKGNQLVQHTIT